jgi:starch synthase
MPIVQRTGGRQDTVVDATLERLATGTATGVPFDEPSAPALLKAVRRAFAVPGQTVMASAEA